MEDPVKEFPVVLQKVLRRPTFETLADTLSKNFTKDCEFHHPYAISGSSMGLRAYTLLFQYVLFFVNYQDVLIRDLAYDAKQNIVVVRMSVRINPWVLLWRKIDMQLLTEFQLEDAIDEETGTLLKKVRVQRDYFIRSPLVQAVPVIGEIYDSDKLRYILADITAGLTEGVQRAFHLLVPAKLREVLFEFWRKHLQIPLGEQLDGLRDKAH